MLGMNGWQRFRSLILPGTLAEVLIGSRVSLMAGWGTVIVAELVAADFGLGAHLIAVEQSYNVPAVIATMICFGLTGYRDERGASRVLERALMPWRRDDVGARVDDVRRRTGIVRRALLPLARRRSSRSPRGKATVLGYRAARDRAAVAQGRRRRASRARSCTRAFWRDVGVSLYEFVAGYAARCARSALPSAC